MNKPSSRDDSPELRCPHQPMEILEKVTGPIPQARLRTCG
jgi:hypothetical protein